MASASGGYVVVAIDFGTTFSGFAFLHKRNPQKVFKFYDWRDQLGAAYSKTVSALYYESDSGGQHYSLIDWGWSALVKCTDAIKFASLHGETTHSTISRRGVTSFKFHDGSAGADNRFGFYVEQFKLDLGEKSNLPLPGDLSTERLIVDFLQCMSSQIMAVLRNEFSNRLDREAVEWCLTVPSIWDEHAKLLMKKCAEKAGLIQGLNCPTPSDASPHPLHIILEPESASFYCRGYNKVNLQKGDRLLIADVGGGTIDLIVHKMTNEDNTRATVEEVVASYGAFGGGTFVDAAFLDLLAEKIGCFKHFCSQEPAALLSIDKQWQHIKPVFRGETPFSARLRLPRRLCKAWEAYEYKNRQQKFSLLEGDVEEDETDYSEITLNEYDLCHIFDPEVNKVLQLIKQQVSGVNMLLLVGGFANSVYLQWRVQEEFKGVVTHIVIPPEPGAAVCHGAVLLHLFPESIQSRISRKTYGLEIWRGTVEDGDPQEFHFTGDGGRKMCKNVFDVFVRMGMRISCNEVIARSYIPVYHKQKHILLRLWRNLFVWSKERVSCSKVIADDKNYIPVYQTQNHMLLRLYSSVGATAPKFITDDSCTLEGSFEISMDKLHKLSEIEVTMVLGTSLTVSIVGKNLGNELRVSLGRFIIKISEAAVPLM